MRRFRAPSRPLVAYSAVPFWVDSDGVDYQVNTAINLAVGDAAKVERIMIGAQGRSALHVSTLTAALGRAVDFRDFGFTTGGAVVRNQLFVRCDSPGTTLGLCGASLLTARQHADTTMVVDHAVGGCRSREVIKSVLDGQSRNVFQGKIIVRPDAQKSDARMLSNALMLSADAEADSKPELEIGSHGELPLFLPQFHSASLN